MHRDVYLIQNLNNALSAPLKRADTISWVCSRTFRVHEAQGIQMTIRVSANFLVGEYEVRIVDY